RFSRDWSSDVCSSDLPPRHGYHVRALCHRDVTDTLADTSTGTKHDDSFPMHTGLPALSGKLPRTQLEYTISKVNIGWIRDLDITDVTRDNFYLPHLIVKDQTTVVGDFKRIIMFSQFMRLA